MNDNPVVGKFAMAPPVPFMAVLAVVSDEPCLGG